MLVKETFNCPNEHVTKKKKLYSTFALTYTLNSKICTLATKSHDSATLYIAVPCTFVQALVCLPLFYSPWKLFCSAFVSPNHCTPRRRRTEIKFLVFACAGLEDKVDSYSGLGRRVSEEQ